MIHPSDSRYWTPTLRSILISEAILMPACKPRSPQIAHWCNGSEICGQTLLNLCQSTKERILVTDWQNWRMPTKKAGSVAVMMTTTTYDTFDRPSHPIEIESSNLGRHSHPRNTRDKNKTRFGANLLRLIEPQKVCIDLAWPFPMYRYNMRLLEVF